MHLKDSLTVVCAAAALMATSVVNAEYFSGKTITWTVPFFETSDSAKWANFFAPLLKEEMPGKPTVLVKFMPGAGSTKGANWFERQTHSDGTSLLGTSGSTQFPYLLGDPRVEYDYKNWNLVMATGNGGVAYLNADDGQYFDGTANKLKGKTFVYGNQGATRLDLVPALAWDMLGLRVRHVMGVKGREHARSMFASGEATIDYQASAAYLTHTQRLVNEGKAVPMMSWGILDLNGVIIRDPTFPALPTFKEVCEATIGCKTSGTQWDAWKALFVAGFVVQKATFLPAGTPPAVVDRYVAAFNVIGARDTFEERSASHLGNYPMYIGASAKAAMAHALNVDVETKNYIISYLEKRFSVTLE